MKYGNVFLRSSLASTFPCTLYRKLTDKASPSCLRIVNDTCKYVSSQPKIITLHYFLSVSMHSPKNLLLLLVMAWPFIVSKHWGSKAVKKSASEHTSTSAYFMCTCMMLCRHHKSNYYFNNCSKENIV